MRPQVELGLGFRGLRVALGCQQEGKEVRPQVVLGLGFRGLGCQQGGE